MRLDLLLLVWVILIHMILNFTRSDEITILDASIDEHARKFDWIDLESNQHLDLYLEKISEGCSNNELKKYLKSRSTNIFFKLLNQELNNINNNVKIMKISKNVMKKKKAHQYPNLIRFYIEWNEFINKIVKKIEMIMKAIVYNEFIPSFFMEDNGIYAPRFLDEIADEIDVLENKKDSIFSQNHLKRLLIPMLIVLKFFKLKLLLFVPLIFGLVSFKNFFGFLAIIIATVIGFLKMHISITQVYTPPMYLPTGIGFPFEHNKENHGLN